MAAITEKSYRHLLKEIGQPTSSHDRQCEVETEPQYGVLTCEACDEIGLSARVSEFMFAQGGNIERWSGAGINGLYQLRCLVSGPPARMLGIRAVYRSILYGLSPRLCSLTPQHTYTIDFACPDAPGVAARTLQRLADENINIAWDDKVVRPAEFFGFKMFFQSVVVERPDGLPADELRAIAHSLELELGGNAEIVPGIQLSHE